MAIYETAHIRKEVYDKLVAQKEQLEETYKREISWSQFFYVLIKNGQCQRITAEDLLDNYDMVLMSVGQLLEPYKLRGIGNANKKRQ